MMKFPTMQRRTLALLAVIGLLLILFAYVAARSGPMAPVAVSVTKVTNRAIAPALFGIGTVSARKTIKVGPTIAGRILQLTADVGDTVKAGQILGEMDAIDMDDRIAAQKAALKISTANIQQAEIRLGFAKTQATRYEQLLAARATTEETLVLKQQELGLADAALAAALAEGTRLRSEISALQAQRGKLKLISPTAGLVVARHAEPGTTVVAGQAVIEIIDPGTLWIDTRFDQTSAEGLAVGLPARITLRSRPGQSLVGRVLRLEPRADAITEESLAKIVFDNQPSPLPPLGELAEVTIQLAALPLTPTIPNAAIQIPKTGTGQRGVWKLAGNALSFTPVTLGRGDLDGQVQVIHGLKEGDRIVVHSEKPLHAGSRIHIAHIDEETGQAGQAVQSIQGQKK